MSTNNLITLQLTWGIGQLCKYTNIMCAVWFYRETQFTFNSLKHPRAKIGSQHSMSQYPEPVVDAIIN